MRDFTEKEFYLTFKTKDGRILYTETGKLKSGIVDATILWTDRDIVSVVVKTKEGNETIFERHLEYDLTKGVYYQAFKK